MKMAFVVLAVVMALVLAAPAVNAGEIKPTGNITVEQDTQWSVNELKSTAMTPAAMPFWLWNEASGDQQKLIHGAKLQFVARTTDPQSAKKDVRWSLGMPKSEADLIKAEPVSDGWGFGMDASRYKLGLNDVYLGTWDAKERTYRFFGVRLFTKTKQVLRYKFITFSVVPGGTYNGVAWDCEKMTEAVQWAYVTDLIGSGGEPAHAIQLAEYKRKRALESSPEEKQLVAAIQQLTAAYNSVAENIAENQAKTNRLIADLLTRIAVLEAKQATPAAPVVTTPTPVEPKREPREVYFRILIEGKPCGPFDLHWKIDDEAWQSKRGYQPSQTAIRFSAPEQSKVTLRIVWCDTKGNVVGEETKEFTATGQDVIFIPKGGTQ